MKAGRNVADEHEIAALKERAREGWALGDYPRLAERLLPAARAVVEACAIAAGQEVLDVAAGNGNAAILAAREGARVVASDLTPAMLELGRERARDEGLEIEWVEADAESLPFGDERFDCVTSIFGAQFAPRPERVAAELCRVVRPGGTVGMANWGPHGFQGGFFGIMRRYGPPDPEGVPPASQWGEEEVVRERFEGLVASVSVERRSLPWRFDSLAAMFEFFQTTAPRQAQLARSLSDERRQELMAEIADLVQRHNRVDDGSVAIDAEYALVVARRRG